MALFFLGALALLSAGGLVLAVGMMIIAGKEHAVYQMRLRLLEQLWVYAHDSSWKESPVMERVKWLAPANGQIRMKDWHVDLFNLLPHEEDLVTGLRVDDFRRWQLHHKELAAASKGMLVSKPERVPLKKENGQ